MKKSKNRFSPKNLLKIFLEQHLSRYKNYRDALRIQYGVTIASRVTLKPKRTGISTFQNGFIIFKETLELDPHPLPKATDKLKEIIFTVQVIRSKIKRPKVKVRGHSNNT